MLIHIILSLYILSIVTEEVHDIQQRQVSIFKLVVSLNQKMLFIKMFFLSALILTTKIDSFALFLKSIISSGQWIVHS